MGFETSYNFRRLQGSQENYEKLLARIGEKAQRSDLADLQYSGDFYGRWYWETARRSIEEASKDFPDVILEVHCEVHDDVHESWEARFKNGESEVVEPSVIYAPYSNGNLLPSPDDPRQFTKDFLDQVLADAVKTYERTYREIVLNRNPSDFDLFAGRNTVGRLIAKAIFEHLAYEYGPLEKDLAGKAQKLLLSRIKTEIAQKS